MSDGQAEYAEKIRQQLHDAGFHADIDSSAKTMPKRIAEASKLFYNYIVVVGKEEMESNMVNVRPRAAEGQKFVPQQKQSVCCCRCCLFSINCLCFSRSILCV